MVSIWLTKVKRGGPASNVKKIGLANRGRFSSNADLRLKPARGRVAKPVLLAILLDAGGAQAGEAMLVDRELPGQEFVDRQRVAAAGFLEGEQATANRGNNFGFTANDPPFGPGRRQIRDGERAAIGPDDVLPSGDGVLSWCTHKLLTTELTVTTYAP